MRFFIKTALPMIVAALLLIATNAAYGQTPQDSQRDNPQPGAGPDLLGQLRLTPDQLQRIRQIQRDTKDERAAIGLRLRESNRALEDALDAQVLDESLIEQRLQAVASAQNAQLRMRIQTEVRIRRVLNPDQLATWHDLRLKAGDIIRSRQDNGGRQNRPGVEGLRPDQRNGIAPLERRNGPLRNPRP